jgi:hypothetical protein
MRTIPRELGSLTNRDLTVLSFFHSSLSGPIPPELGNLINLKYLLLSDDEYGVANDSNNFSGKIPPQLGTLT